MDQVAVNYGDEIPPEVFDLAVEIIRFIGDLDEEFLKSGKRRAEDE